MAATSRHERQVRAIRCQARRLVPTGAHLRRRLDGTGKTTADSDIVEARFIDIVPGVRVVQAVTFVADDPDLAGTMTMTWEVTATDDGTRVDIRADQVPAGISAEDHAAGLASSLANLAVYVQRGTT